MICYSREDNYKVSFYFIYLIDQSVIFRERYENKVNDIDRDKIKLKVESLSSNNPFIENKNKEDKNDNTIVV